MEKKMTELTEMTNERLCANCKKEIGDSSYAFFYPDVPGKVEHLCSIQCLCEYCNKPESKGGINL